MAKRPCRTPQFINDRLVVSSYPTFTSEGSVILRLEFDQDSSKEIILLENFPATENNGSSYWGNWGVSSLCLDYININGYSGSGYNTSVRVDFSINWFTGQNGSGGAPIKTVTGTFYALEGYFISDVSSSAYNYGSSLIQYGSGGAAQSQLYLPIPQDVESEVPYYSTEGFKYKPIASGDTGQFTVGGGLGTSPLTKFFIERVCIEDAGVHNGDYKPIAFINKFGAFQQMWFVQSKESTDASRSTYPSIDYGVAGKWDGSKHYYKDYQTKMRRKVSLISFPMPEGSYFTFQEIMASEYVWYGQWDYVWQDLNKNASGTFLVYPPESNVPITITLPFTFRGQVVRSMREPIFQSGSETGKWRKLYKWIPVNVKNSSVSKSMSNLQRANIQYNVDLEYAFEEIPSF